MKRAGKRSARAAIPASLLMAAYAAGYFPMADEETGEIGWYSPDPRAIIPLDAFRITRSLRQVMNKGIFEVRVDTAFEDVIRHCADRARTWISEEIIRSYAALHRLGAAHSIEAWHDGRLAGGLYGVALGAAFFGESMFSLRPNASKVALVRLVERLRDRGFVLLDTQYMTPHLARFGAVQIPRAEYLERLRPAVAMERRFRD